MSPNLEHNQYLQLIVIALVLFCLGYILIYWMYKKMILADKHVTACDPHWHPWIKFFVDALMKPFIFLCCGYAINYSWQFIQIYYLNSHYFSLDLSFYFIKIIEFITVYWSLFNVMRLGSKKIMKWALATDHPAVLYMLPPIISSLQGAIFFTMINILIPMLNLNSNISLYLNKFATVILILIIGWIFYKILTGIEQYIIDRYVNHTENAYVSRKIHTQLILLKRLLFILIGIIIFSAVLMVFDGIRALGASILTTAGILGAIGAFASQQSLGRIFAGLQIAFTQPIRIGDTVIIDNEFGQIEEITLSFIIVKLWDLRRLILPTDYFINKGLLNLTRESSELLGTIFLYVDYGLPIEALRQEFQSLLNASSLWNKKVMALEVTDMKEKSMEIRCLLSANNASDLWKLRCEIREKLIQYIVARYPHCLTKTRSMVLVDKNQNLPDNTSLS